MLDALNLGLAGISAGFERLNRTAERIARDGAQGDLSGEMVELMRAKADVRANVVAARTADDTFATILDVLA